MLAAAAAAIAAAPRRFLKAATYLLLLPVVPLLCDCGVSAAAAAAPEAALFLRGDSSISLTSLPEQQQQRHEDSQQYQPVVSDELLLDLLRRAETIRGGPPGAPAGGWEVLAENGDCMIYRRRREGALDFEYAMRGYFSDLSAAAYLTALNSLPVRTAWDKTAKDVRLLKVTQLPAAAAEYSSSSRSGIDTQREGEGAPPQDEGPPAVHAAGGPEYEELIYWRVGLPWPAQDRDFVFARRLRAYKRSSSSGSSSSGSSSSGSSSSGSSSSRDVYALVCGQLQLDIPEMPETKDAVRITFFEAAVVAFPENVGGDGEGDTPSQQGQASCLHKASLGSSRPAGGDPQRNGVTYVALHYDRSKSPVPSWLRAYVATQSLPATMRTLHSTALLWLSPSGKAKDLRALRGPQGAPFTEDELLLLEQQYNIHSVQWGGPAEPPSAAGGAPQNSLQLPGPQQQQQQQLQQQQQQQQQAGSDVAAIASAPDSTAAAGGAAAAAAAAELRQLLVGASGDTEASCASRPVPVPLVLGGPHELIRGAPPFILAVRVIPEAIGGAPWWGPLKRVTLSPRWGPTQAAGEALKWALRLLGPPWMGPRCACADVRHGGPSSGSPFACRRRGPLAILGGGPQGVPCPLSKATGLPCGHSGLRGVVSGGEGAPEELFFWGLPITDEALVGGPLPTGNFI
ncbi:hypothetical protein Esti_003322 [Eimeria stiedai]